MTQADRTLVSSNGSTTNRQWIFYLLLAVVVLSGFTLRVWNVNFDQGIGSHPDERSTSCFYAPSIRLPSSVDEFLDPQRSPMNPLWDTTQQTRRSFTYGHFPLYLGIATGEVMHQIAPVAERLGAPGSAVNIMARAHQDCDAIAVAGRLTIAFLDTLTIILLFLLGRALFGSVAGLLAATFYAFTAQAIQLSHFFAMDPASTTFVVLAVYGGVTTIRYASYGSAILTGVAAGLAIASKFSSLPILAVPVTAGLLVIILEGQRAQRDGDRSDGRLQFRAVIGIFIALGAAAISFTVTSPYAVLDWQSFIQATLIEQGRMVRGIADMPFTRQYRNTLPYIYFLQQQVQWGLWWPLGLLALAGTATMFVHLIVTLTILLRNWLPSNSEQPQRIRIPQFFQSGNVVVWSWVLPYFAITGAFLAKFNRYMSPLLPFAALFAAGLLWLLWSSGRRATIAREVSRQKRTNWRSVIAAIIAVVVVSASIFWSVAYVNGVYRGEHNWITASRWIYENAPEGSTILWELWDDPLPKTIPGEPGMDMGSTGLRNIDWSPYEEDTAEKYELLKSKLREADYIAYSSKRIYDSVDELPDRYPMTTEYYEAMWDGSLGFELALDITSPPRLFGLTFEDGMADESWSLYDHPQVTIFRKVRDISDAEFDARLGETWRTAVHYDTGDLSVADKLLILVGLRGEPGAEYSGLFGGLLRLIARPDDQQRVQEELPSLMFDTPLSELSIVDNYRWNEWASERAWAATLIWWLSLTLLGWFIWPMLFHLFGAFRDRGYFLSRTAGWLLAGWLLWYAASYGLLENTVRNSWLAAIAIGFAGIAIAIASRRKMYSYLRSNWQLLLAGEVLVGLAYTLFILIRMANPDLWQPWFGGEKFMEFAFLNGILRSPTFPPVDPHFAGGFINYYYFGIYLATYLIKLTGIYAEVGFNLTIAAIFALTVSNAFAIAYTAWGMAWKARSWRSGFLASLLAPLFVAVVGNLSAFTQVVRSVADQVAVTETSLLGTLSRLPEMIVMLAAAVIGRGPLQGYDFWAPSRVIPNTINEFPYWSFLFADLHPHVIGIPLALLFAGFLLAILGRRDQRPYSMAALIAGMAFLLGALSSVNLWELPTYLALGVLGIAVYQFSRYRGIRPLSLFAASVGYVVLAYLLFLPFFRNYVNIGASGVGLVRKPDLLSIWILIWGLFIFVIASWLVYAFSRRPRECAEMSSGCAPAGYERAYSLSIRKYDRLPRMIYLHRLLVSHPTIGYLFCLVLAPVGLLAGLVLILVGQSVLGLCLMLLTPALLLLWKRGSDSDPAALFIALLSVTSLAILAGTQIVYLRDFLQGGDWYRMNTLFKFFIQVWVLFALAAAIAVPRIWSGLFGSRVELDAAQAQTEDSSETVTSQSRVTSDSSRPQRLLAYGWATALVLLITASMAFVVFGTPARLAQRMNGWRPDFGTLNAMAYMREGTYTWPDNNNLIELQYDWDAINWLLDHVRGNPIIVESSEVDYYRAGGTRVASLTGISGLRGMHESEQRPGAALSEREALHREFWSTDDVLRTQDIIDQLDVSLIYVGQLERFLHPNAVLKLEAMADEGMLFTLYSNDGVDIYGVRDRLVELDEDVYAPARIGDRSAAIR